MIDQPPPATKRDAAFRILFSELSELFAKVESLIGTVEAADMSAKQTARTLQESLRVSKQLIAALPDKPVPMIEAKRANPVLVGLVTAVVAGLVAGGVVAGAFALLGNQREEARVGRTVTAAFATLDPVTRAKLQAAIDKAAQ
jgi:hypothetical protein